MTGNFDYENGKRGTLTAVYFSSLFSGGVSKNSIVCLLLGNRILTGREGSSAC